MDSFQNPSLTKLCGRKPSRADFALPHGHPIVDDTLTKREHLALASNSQRRTGLEQLQHLLARLFTSNIATDTKALYQSRKLSAISLEAATYTENQPKIAPILDMTMPVRQLSPITVKSIQDKFNSSGFWGRNAIAPLPSAPPSEITPTIPPLPSAPPPEITTTVLENTDFSEQMDTRFAALSTHFDLMQEFLASQNRITTALFSPATTLNYQQHFPFIEQVFEQNEQYLYCQRIFIASDIFIYNHTLGGKTSHLHPEITALPVIPFAISMEILAEAAVYLGGGNKCVTGIYNIRSYSWLALEAEQLVIDIVAQTQSVTDKDAIRQWAKQHFALELAPVDIQILSTSLGKPVVQVPELANLTPLPDISISHSQNFYVAVVSSVGLQVGIDIQKLNAVRSDDWLDVAFSSLELAMLTQLLQKKTDLLMGAWCAKEAAAKAVGIGLQGNPHQWQITSFDTLRAEATEILLSTRRLALTGFLQLE